MNIRESVSSLGSDVIYVDKWPWIEESGQEYQWWQYINRPVPTYQEYVYLNERSLLSSFIGFTVRSNSEIQYKDNRVENITVHGVTEEFEYIRDFEIMDGRYFTAYEMHSGRGLCVLGNTVATKLFENTSPLGKQITVQGHKVTVLGVITKEGKSDFGDSMDEALIVPINHMRNVVNIRRESMSPMIWVKAGENVSNEALMSVLRMLLRSIRRLKPNAGDNFALNRSSMLDSQLDQVFSTLNVAGWFIGLFSLLVGGFGIANIMFVGVKERTNIIGIQKALGAKRYYILLQFIFEAILLAVSGGIVGLFLVYSGTLLIGMMTDFSISLTAGNVLTGIIISSLIGLIAGFAPAYTAARLDPVTAINTSF
jgi:putative ABC transport system permease protein